MTHNFRGLFGKERECIINPLIFLFIIIFLLLKCKLFSNFEDFGTFLNGALSPGLNCLGFKTDLASFCILDYCDPCPWS